MYLFFLQASGKAVEYSFRITLLHDDPNIYHRAEMIPHVDGWMVAESDQRLHILLFPLPLPQPHPDAHNVGLEPPWCLGCSHSYLEKGPAIHK